MLNLGGKIPLKGGISQPGPAAPPSEAKPAQNEPKSSNVPALGGVPKLGLNLENLKQKDFQDEFMEKFDEYSKSWRDMIEQQRRF